MALSFVGAASVANAQDVGHLRIADGGAPATMLPAGAMMMGDQGKAAAPAHGSMVIHGGAAAGCNSCGASWGNWGGCVASCDYDRFGVFGEFLYLRLRNADVPFAQSVDGLGDEALPTGPIGSVRPDYEPAYRFGILYSPMERVTIRGQYLQYNSRTSATVVAPEGDILRSLVTHPNTLNNAEDSLLARGQVDNDLRLIDVDTLVSVVDCGPYTLHAFTGARYAELKQGFAGRFDILGSTDVRTSSNFYGIGPRVGLEGQVWVRGGFSSYAKTAANFLVGDVSADYRQTNIFQDQLVNASFRKARVLTNLELELGVAWTGMGDRVTVSGGYMLSSWSNVISTNGLIQAVQQNDFTTNRDNLRDTIVFDGFVARIEVRF